jgi:cold shock CspA family protein
LKTYNSPKGHAIIGTSEKVLATASISGINDDGTPVYAGGSEVHWDTQRTLTTKGKICFVCESGNEWTFDQLTAVVEETADA